MASGGLYVEKQHISPPTRGENLESIALLADGKNKPNTRAQCHDLYGDVVSNVFFPCLRGHQSHSSHRVRDTGMGTLHTSAHSPPDYPRTGEEYHVATGLK